MKNDHIKLTLLETTRCGTPGDVSFPAIEGGGVKSFGLHLSGSAGSEVQASSARSFSESLFRMMTETSSVGKFGGVSGRVDAGRLQLRGRNRAARMCLR